MCSQPIIPKLGDSLPPGDQHGVSVSLITWENTLAWARRDPDLLIQLKAGYPRFFVPLVIRKLSKQLLRWAASRQTSELPTDNTQMSGRESLLFPRRWMATDCQEFFGLSGKQSSSILCFTFSGTRQVCMEDNPAVLDSNQTIYMVTFPEDFMPKAKSFWQHSGLGISTRFATFWLDNAPFLNDQKELSVTGRLPPEDADKAHYILRERISDLLSTKDSQVGAEDVYLYPTGMSAIYHTAAAINHISGKPAQDIRAAVFGFLYVDTFKVLSKVYRFNCVLYGHANGCDLDLLEKDLKSGLQIDALYTEFPGNPLLSSPDLRRLDALAKQYGFILIVDDTVATSVNVSILPLCDIICTSLTKMFSGSCNVMGGSIILNPKSARYQQLCQAIGRHYDNAYFPLDVLVMERNSADFEGRVLAASRNADHLVELLRVHSTVDEVFYPKGSSSQSFYEEFKQPERGHGFLLSIRFVKPAAAMAFHDSLDVAKGPSLGTNFTLCCAYTLLAHYSELEWAAKFGVVEHLVRISVGIESQGYLERLFRKALEAAARAAE